MKKFEKLYQHSKKTITKAELHTLLSAHSDEDLFHLLQEPQFTEALSPVKASGTNGNHRFPIYLKYKILQATKDTAALAEEINGLHPALLRSGVLQAKPGEYEKHGEAIKLLNNYLFTAEKQCLSISRKERSFEIFGEEKLLENSSFCGLLEKLGLDKTVLRYYDTPEYCFNDFIPLKKPDMTLLICENKDIWFNLRRTMFEEGARVLFDTHIDGVIYGCGNRVSEKNALTAYTQFMGNATVKYLYWGDIDRAGLNIFFP